MPGDATYEILANLQERSEGTLSLIAKPEWNIEDMDPRFCMINLMFSGMYCFLSTKPLDAEKKGRLLINGQPCDDGLVIPDLMPMFGQLVAIRARKYLTDYDRAYQIRISGLIDTEGRVLDDFEVTIRTLKKHEAGEVFPEHDAVVLQAARESAVLLKNEAGTLPLGKGAVVNVFGAGAVVFRSGCLGAGKINPRYSIRVKEGIETYSSMKLNEELYDFYRDETNALPPEDVLDRAFSKNHTAVVFLSRTSSEAQDNPADRGHYYLTEDEEALINGVSARFDRTVVVLNTAYPIDTSWRGKVSAILYVGLPGMAGGRALAEILEGSVTPSGRLPVSWAEDYQDYPSSRNFLFLKDVKKTCPEAEYVTTVYEEGLYVGYRYFDTFKKMPAFPFGYGLSYTSFEREVKSLCKSDSDEKDVMIRFSVTVTNTGAFSGKDVAALYAKIPDGRLEQPERRLAAFAKTRLLQPGDTENVLLEVPSDRLRSFDPESGCWIIESGTIRFFLDDQEAGELNIPETLILKKAGGRIPSPIPIRELSKQDPEDSYPKGASSAFQADQLPYETKRTGEDRKDPRRKASEFLLQMSDEELIRLLVGGKTGWGNEDSGFAGMIYKGGILEKYQLPEYYFCDGNNGLNLFEPNIGFPTSATMACSFDEALLYEEGKAIAEEAKARKMNCILAPALNLQRNILCGRHTEYFSEDPLLAGRLAGQENRGFEENGVSGCMKHFFANNAEMMRNRNHSLMTERTARELYIAAFEYAFSVKKPDTVMTGYNAANGCYCSNDPELLQGILRDEMGFDGFVMTDWNGYGNHGPAALLSSGISFIAPGSEDGSITGPIEEAVREGKISRDTLILRAEELMNVVNKQY